MNPPLSRFLLDVRASFPYSTPPQTSKKYEWAATPPVVEALGVLNESEKAHVLRYYFPRDAALSLGSCLLKHLAVVRACGVAWEDSEITQKRDVQNGKPYYKPGGIEFNVSHHGEASVLVASIEPGVKVGIDLVKVDMVKDAEMVRKNGFEGWVRIYQDVFSDREVDAIISSVPKGSLSGEVLKQGLRRFYAHWALKEAYLKMTGDGLNASWLKELEFDQITAPTAATDSSIQENKWAWGSSTKAHVYLQGKALGDVKLELQALGEYYMVVTATNSPSPLHPFETIVVERDILSLVSS